MIRKVKSDPECKKYSNVVENKHETVQSGIKTFHFNSNIWVNSGRCAIGRVH